jgi:phosphoribosylformylglycinamidine cyclo-ligase
MCAHKDLYENMGVDAGKKGIQKIVKGSASNDYPGAFVNIVIDLKNPEIVFTLHVDGAGSKILQNLLVFNETGNIAVIQGAVDDALSMNMGDVASGGLTSGKIIVSDILNIKSIENSVPKDDILKQIILRFKSLLKLYQEKGFEIYFLGGETADLPDQTKNVTFDVAVFAEAFKGDIISGNTKAGDKIFGFKSYGQAEWEESYNSGLMSNGFTLARPTLMWEGYTEKYPFLWDKNPYTGKYKVGDTSSLVKELSVSDALLSPTRQWSILIRLLLELLKERGISHMLHGISMNTGGGATKIGNVGTGGILYYKKMPEPPGIFQLIKREGKVTWEEMFKVFNNGIGLDVVGEDHSEFQEALEEISVRTNVGLVDLGCCAGWKGNENKILLETPYGTFNEY